MKEQEKEKKKNEKNKKRNKKKNQAKKESSKVNESAECLMRAHTEICNASTRPLYKGSYFPHILCIFLASLTHHPLHSLHSLHPLHTLVGRRKLGLGAAEFVRIETRPGNVRR